MPLFPAGTVLELGAPWDDPNAPNIKHVTHEPSYNTNMRHLGRPIIQIGQASPAAEAAALAGAADAARMPPFMLEYGSRAHLYNLEARQAGEMQRRMQDQQGYTEFRGCKEGEFDLCAFENPRTGDVRAFKRPFIPIGGEDPFLVLRELTTASRAPMIARSRILHPGVLQQHPLMSRAMRSAVSANPDLAARSGLASILARRLTEVPLAGEKEKKKLEKNILKELPPSPFSKMGGKKRTGRARLRSRFRSRRRG
jgi:hypothetical protein